MKIVALKTMLSNERYEEIKNGDPFLGKDKCFYIKGELYFLVRDAEDLGYIILPGWVKEV